MNDDAAIPLSRPWLDRSEIDAVERVIKSGWIMQGEEVVQFEKEFADHAGAPHACAVSSGTAALHLALLAVGVQPGDEVITVSYSFIATANSIRHCGAIPIFGDIDPTDNNIDPSGLEALITPRTRAILCVHQMGIPCDLRSLLSLARRHGLLLIEDAACAVGSEILLNDRWEKIGRPHGDIACFSFHPRKILTTGEGGMVTTSREEWDATIRRLRQHGLSKASDGTAAFHGLGYNYRMTDIQAAIGREQLLKMPAMLARRREQADRYDRLLAGIPQVSRPNVPPWKRPNWQTYWIKLDFPHDAKQVGALLAADGVAAAQGVRCAHLEPAYSKTAETGQMTALPFSEEAGTRCLALPLSHDLDERSQKRVATSLAKVLDA